MGEARQDRRRLERLARGDASALVELYDAAALASSLENVLGARPGFHREGKGYVLRSAGDNATFDVGMPGYDKALLYRVVR